MQYVIRYIDIALTLESLLYVLFLLCLIFLYADTAIYIVHCVHNLYFNFAIYIVNIVSVVYNL